MDDSDSQSDMPLVKIPLVFQFKKKNTFSNDLFIFTFWPCFEACEILVTGPGIQPSPPALEMQS